MISRICLRANSTSRAGRCFCLAVMISMSSDFVMPFVPEISRCSPAKAAPAGCSYGQSRSPPICSFSRSPRLVPVELPPWSVR